MTDDDPFSRPDPADTGDDTVEPEFEAQTTDPSGDVVLVDADASCHNCSHFEVCAIYSGIRPMMMDWHTEDSEQAEAPIEIDKLAWHCKKYDPVE